jgi:hypothetical protein
MFRKFLKFIELVDDQPEDVSESLFEEIIPKDIPFDKIIERDFSLINQENIEKVLTFLHQWQLENFKGFMNDFLEYVHHKGTVFNVSNIKIYDIEEQLDSTCIDREKKCQTTDEAVLNNHSFCLSLQSPNNIKEWFERSTSRLSPEIYSFIFRCGLFDTKKIMNYFFKNQKDDEETLCFIVGNFMKKIDQSIYYHVIKEGMIECLKLLLNGEKLQPVIVNRRRENPIIVAIEHGQIKMYEYLITQEKPEGCDYEFCEELASEYAYDNHISLRYFLERGKEIDVRGLESVFFRALETGSLDLVKAYVDAGVNVNYGADIFRITLLGFAACSKIDPVEKIKYLVEKGSDANMRDRDGRTLLEDLRISLREVKRDELRSKNFIVPSTHDYSAEKRKIWQMINFLETVKK